jgi:hypothetical protein
MFARLSLTAATFAATVLIAAVTCVQAAASKAETHRGFTIDDSLVRDLPNLDAVRTATKEQIDIVCAVGLPAEIMKFFQRVPLVILPQSAIPRTSPGLYANKDRVVKLTSRIAAVGHKPVLLHEFLHAFHDQRMKDGFGNRTIMGHFDHAKTVGVYASNSHMMRNTQEFFACTGTTYLFGVTAQEPFQRAKISDHLPEYFGYLKTLFGPETGSYVGSLTRANSSVGPAEATR